MSKVAPQERDWLKENEHIVVGLQDINSTLSFEQYRTFGSLIPASLEKPYRRISDIDLFVDAQVKSKTKAKFSEMGYKISPVEGFGNIFGITPLRFTKGETIIDMFFGDFDEKGGWRLSLKWGFSAYIPPTGMKSQILEFGGVSFSGISTEAAFYATSFFSENPIPELLPSGKERERGIEILKTHHNEARLKKLKKEGPGLWFKGVSIPTEPLARVLSGLGKVFGAV